MQVPKHLNSFI